MLDSGRIHQSNVFNPSVTLIFATAIDGMMLATMPSIAATSAPMPMIRDVTSNDGKMPLVILPTSP